MKLYIVEGKLGSKWFEVRRYGRHTDALHYIKEHGGGKYQLRLLRITKEIIFDEKSFNKDKGDAKRTRIETQFNASERK